MKVILLFLFLVSTMSFAKDHSIYCIAQSSYYFIEPAHEEFLLKKSWEFITPDFYANKTISKNLEGNHHVDAYELNHIYFEKLFSLTIIYENFDAEKEYDSVVQTKNLPEENKPVSRNTYPPNPFYIYSESKPHFNIEWRHLNSDQNCYYELDVDYNNGDDRSVLTIHDYNKMEVKSVILKEQFVQKIYEWTLKDMTKMDSLAYPTITIEELLEYEKNIDIDAEPSILRKVDSSEFYFPSFWEKGKKIIHIYKKTFPLIAQNKKMGYYKFAEIDEPDHKYYWELYLMNP